MSTQSLDDLPDPKFSDGQYITDNNGQSFEVRFVEYDFDQEEYYYLPLNGQYAGKIYETNATLTDPPKSQSMKTYELIFGDRESMEED